jgi:hypothetical protein
MTMLDEQVNQYLRYYVKPILNKPKDEWTIAECCGIYQLGFVLCNWSERITKELAGWTPRGEKDFLNRTLGPWEEDDAHKFA